MKIMLAPEGGRTLPHSSSQREYCPASVPEAETHPLRPAQRGSITSGVCSVGSRKPL